MHARPQGWVSRLDASWRVDHAPTPSLSQARSIFCCTVRTHSPGRAHEAATHLSVAGVLLARQLAAPAAGQHPTLLAMDGGFRMLGLDGSF